jgi:hypothetical protein
MTYLFVIPLVVIAAPTVALSQTADPQGSQQKKNTEAAQNISNPRQLPPPTDVDPNLTEELRRLELELGEAARHGFQDTKVMERLVSPEFTQRVSDAPERSLPRSLWGQPSSAYRIESLDQRHHAARSLSEDLAVISLLMSQKATFEGRDRSGDFYLVDIWKKGGDRWQLIARYSCPVGKKFDRPVPR